MLIYRIDYYEEEGEEGEEEEKKNLNSHQKKNGLV